jgi:flavin reductase (DIM6/NTAB) family NADH-FMN oxidoreductase RutF
VIRSTLHRLARFAGRVPRYVPIGERDPQGMVRVTLDGLAAPLDVTRNHVMVGLRPLTIAVALPDIAPAAVRRTGLRLRFSPAADLATTLGSVRLRHVGEIGVEHTTFQLFHASGHTRECLPPAAELVFRANHAWEDWKRRRKRNFHMERRDLGAFEVMYLCPRPVVLVTVRHGSADNLFPMDLIGPTHSPYFLMALRNTSPSIRLIRESRRLTLADVPLELTREAFKLGDHHEKERIDLTRLPFETTPSPGHGRPGPRDALRVRDVAVRDAHVVGSHTMFVTQVVREERWRDGLQMFFLAGPYERYLTLRGTVPPRGW